MAKRQVMFSFEYNKDNWRAGQVRNMGVVSNNSTFSGNEWEEVKEKTDTKIKAWINEQLAMRSCLVVLVGATTSSRKWVKYEIEKAYEMGKAIVGVYIHGLKNSEGNQTTKGSNPFYNIFVGENNERLSKYIECYDPPYKYSTNVYNNIEEKLEQLIEDAITNKGNYPD